MYFIYSFAKGLQCLFRPVCSTIKGVYGNDESTPVAQMIEEIFAFNTATLLL